MTNTKKIQNWVPRIRSGSGPKYLAIVDALEKGIAAGELSPGDSLPTQREIAILFGVTIATVTKAIAESVRRGIVFARKGSGTFIAEFQQSNGSSFNMVELGLNTLPVSVVQKVLDTSLISLANKQNSHHLFGYVPFLGDDVTRRVGKYWVEKSGWRDPSGTIYPIQGTQQGLMAAISCLTERGDAILCEALTFTGILRINEQLGLKTIGVALDDEGVIPAALDEAFATSGAKVVVLTPTTQNPTRSTMSAVRRREIAAICKRHDGLLIEDGIFMPLVGDAEPPISAHMENRAIFFTGLSKSVAPGFRLSFAVVPTGLESRFNKRLLSSNWLAPPFFAELAAGMIESGALDECVRLHRKEAMARLNLVNDLIGIGLSKDSAPSYHAWVKIPPEWSVDELLRMVFTNGIRIAPIHNFCCPNITPPSAFRISLGAEEDRRVLEEGLRRLAEILKRPGHHQTSII